MPSINTDKGQLCRSGELIYEWTSGSTYRFYFKLYRDCGGITEPSTLPLCFSNSCNSSSFTATLAKFPQTVFSYKFSCPQAITKCDNPSATLPGYQEIWYYVDVTLPFQCNSWRAFTYLATRSASLNLANASSTNMYIEATFNNTGTFEGNSSPYYSVWPFINACQATTYTYNNGAVDPNSDSLVNEVIQSITGISSCSGTASNVSFASASPSLGLPANPFQTNNTFSLNAQNGLISFTPAQPGTSTLAIRTKEYRNGVLVGSIMREMPVNAYNCGIPSNPILVPGGSPINGIYHTCNGQPISFSFDVKSANPNAIFYVSHAGLPGASVTYVNQGTDSVTGNITWTAPVNASGIYNLAVTVYDSTCAPPGHVYYYTFALPFYVWNQVNAGPDTTLCIGATADLKLPVAGSYTWLVVSGDMNSLSCTTCTQPTVSPNVTSQYQVTVNNLPAGCPPKQDVITVDVIPHNKPSASIVVSPGTNVWPGLNVTFTATTVYCDTPQYQWRRNGNDVSGATNATFNTTTLANNDIVTCLLTCRDSCLIDTPSNAITMNVATGVKNIATGGTRLFPNPNNGTFTIELSNAVSTLNLDIINTLGQTVWSQHIEQTSAVKTLEIQTNTLPLGHYILKLGDSKQTDVLQFSIQR